MLYMFLAGLLQRPGKESRGHFPRLLHNVLLTNMQNTPNGLNVVGNMTRSPTHPQRIMSIKHFLICYGIIDPE